jgi:N-acetylmuramoyl-L-alanine amidase
MTRKTIRQKLIIGVTIACLIFLSAQAEAFLQAQQHRFQVIIDPGHGGTDSGARIYDRVTEKDLTLAISLLLQKELEKTSQFTVRLTRTSNQTISMEDRARLIMSVHPDIVISIHLNAGFGKNSSGFEAYFSESGQRVNSRKNAGSDEAGQIVADMTANRYLNDSVRLARLILREQEDVFPRKSRGLREVNLPLQTLINMPYVLIEVGFATQEDDRKKIMEASTQQAIATAMSRGIQAYFRKEIP